MVWIQIYMSKVYNVYWKYIFQKLLGSMQSNILLLILKFHMACFPSVFSQRLVSMSVTHFQHYNAILRLMFVLLLWLPWGSVCFLLIFLSLASDIRIIICDALKRIAQWIDISLSIFLILKEFFDTAVPLYPEGYVPRPHWLHEAMDSTNRFTYILCFFLYMLMIKFVF